MGFFFAAASGAVGYLAPQLLPDTDVLEFTQALLASSFGVFLALGIAIWVIDVDCGNSPHDPPNS